ncbi:hybrid sensor histidine kinase/response regulator [Runella slithyformis]|uniref:histidine kinase n=1 Tax=Runella slithyformis (strain ATCC 29530 / DSM 19594 / LMG 11500 / NCIMB 11436 / LSU 4) TaxID=761193 RepID=A0A7U4E4Z1_RUNSL|nr:hybrid sensor histidine kinase/response regulator [Runella slithyformis]AEI47784.1 signal transduction histidine kinase, nitrogen specific, NtrB [Runella slithyformis DSM 19594]
MQKDTIRLLIVDDDEDDFFLTSDYLKDIRNKTFVITWAGSFTEGIDQLTHAKFDLCFFDFLLGAKTGIDLLKAAIQSGVSCPIVLLTGKGDQQVDVEAMRLGAMDYLVKSELDSEKLDRCIRYALERSIVLQRLRESETRLRGIFGQLKDAVLLKWPKGLIFYNNNTALDLLGYTESEILRLCSQDLFAIPAQHAMYIQALEEKGLVENLEVWLVRKSGERVLCSLHASKQNDSEGSGYYLLVIQDITARKKVERDKLLAEKSASTARLVRTLAHEVRNPLTNIHLSLDQLEADLQDDDQRLFADIIRRNSKRINVLISELLNSFKPQEAILRRISIHDLLEQTLSEAEDRLSLKKIRLIKNYGEDCLLLLDEPKIKIALLNLIINAIEAMEESKGELTLSTYTVATSCYVEVQDNGSGISPENINRLFEPYFTSKMNGLGLGLAATLTILQSHRATVEVESEVGKGTTFTVTFPLGELKQVQEN